MANSSIELNDFSGGIQELRAPADFDGGQWAQLKGFVLEGDGRARSQWACQQIGGTGLVFQAVRGLVCAGGSYLVGITVSGLVYYMPEPDRTSDWSSALGEIWTFLADVPANPDYRILGEVPLPASGAGRANALLIHAQAGTSPAVAVYENTDGSGLMVQKWTNFYPSMAAVDGVDSPTTGKMPRANIATVWGSRLILGDISYLKDASGTTLSSSTVTRYPSSIWYSEARIDSYHVLSQLNLGSAETQLVGLHVLDDTLVAITSAATERDGCIIVRGDLAPTSETDHTPQVKKSVLRGGVGAPPRPASLKGHYGYSCLWAETGAVVFLDRLGGVWHTEGTEVSRLDRFGPAKPPVAQVGDHVAALGPYLFLSRDGRLLCFRYLGELGDGTGTGSWTELITPVEGQVRSLAPLGDCMYFVAADGTVWRYTLEGPASSERGMVNGAKVDLTVSTATQPAPEGHTKALWYRFGMTLADNAEESEAAGELVSATVRSGPALPTISGQLEPGLTTQLGRPLADRADFMVPAGFASSEVSATVVLRGDVTLESATFTISGKAAKRGTRP